MNPLSLTAVEAGAAIRRGALSASEYADALLVHCKKHARLNAFVAQDEHAVRAAARKADDDLAAGRDRGPLHGIPIVLKDNIHTAEMATTGGTPGLRHHRPKANAPVAQALLDAGAILLGKTTLHELAYGVTNNNAAFGPARNPYNPALVPGGSSGGTGVAVAARMAAAGLGTDTGGSVRIPASLCGCYGFRPTTKRYSQSGIVPISHTRDTAGPLARSVEDCVLIDGLVTAGPRAVEPAALRGLRLGVPRAYFYPGLDPAVAAVAERALAGLRRLGAVLVEQDVPELGALNQATGFPVALYETVTTLAAYLKDNNIGIDLRELFERTASPDVHGILMSLLGAQAISEPVYREALEKHRPALQATLADYFRRHDVSGIVFPTTPMPARPIGQDETVEVAGLQMPTFFTYIRNTDPGSNAGLPGLSVPAGLTPDGLPVGMEIDGPAGSDLRILSIGLAWQKSLEPLPPPL